MTLPPPMHSAPRRSFGRSLRAIPAGIVVAVVVVVILAAIALTPSRVAVDIATASRSTLRVTIQEAGQASARDRVVITAPTLGRLLPPPVRPGDRVQRGKTVVATIATDTSFQGGADSMAAVLSAERAVQQARADALAELVYESLTRLIDLFVYRATPTAASDAEQRRAPPARDGLASASARLRSAQQDALRIEQPASRAPARGNNVKLRAPTDGIVLRYYRDPGAIVVGGEPVVAIGDPRHMEAIVPVLSRDAVRVKPGERATIRDWGGPPLSGHVTRVDPAAFTVVSALGVTEQRVNVSIAFDDPPSAAAAGLGDGFRLEAEIVVREVSDAVKAAATSVFRHDTGWAVFVVDNSRARLQPVKIGARTETDVEILDGLRAGEHIVVHPADTLTDGTRVTARAASGAP
jgi:HlyD family secretion protein